MCLFFDILLKCHIHSKKYTTWNFAAKWIFTKKFYCWNKIWSVLLWYHEATQSCSIHYVFILLTNNTIILAIFYSALCHMPRMRLLVSHNSTIFIIFPKSCHLSWSKLQILWSQSPPFLTWVSQYSSNWTFCSFFPFRAYSQHSLKNELFRIVALSCHFLLKAF